MAPQSLCAVRPGRLSTGDRLRGAPWLELPQAVIGPGQHLWPLFQGLVRGHKIDVRPALLRPDQATQRLAFAQVVGTAGEFAQQLGWVAEESGRLFVVCWFAAELPQVCLKTSYPLWMGFPSIQQRVAITAVEV